MSSVGSAKSVEIPKKIIPQSDASKQKYLLVDLSFGARIVKKAKKITSTFLFFQPKATEKINQAIS